MKAAVYYGRRDVRVEDAPSPGPPGPGELLLEVAAAGICGTDASEWAHGPFFAPLVERHPFSGHIGPTILGHEFVGRVAAPGPGVDGFEPGDLVACGAGVWCGNCRWCREGRTNLCARYYTLGLNTHGGLAELVLAPARTCRRVPEGLRPAAAALAQPVAVALHAARRTGVASGDRLAVIGIGGIGSLILAAARYLGVDDIIAVDVNSDRLASAARLGAADVVDASAADVVSAITDLTNGDGADVVIEASGAPNAPGDAIAAVRRGGRVLLVGLQAAPRELDLHSLTTREVDLHTTNAHVCDADLPDALRLIERQDLAAVVAQKLIDLEDLVAEGLEPLSVGKARSKIIVALGD